jgi:hypothetical protein
VEFAAKEAAAKKFMMAERRAVRELEVKTVCNASYPTWQAYKRQCREEAEATTATKRAAATSAGREATSQPPNQPQVFINLGNSASTSGDACH